jgi:hypothetical protein
MNYPKQTSYLPEVKDLLNLCPICGVRPKYHKVEKIKVGTTHKDDFGRYYFSQAGWNYVNVDYWSCKKCTKDLSTKEYNDFIINNQHLFICPKNS